LDETQERVRAAASRIFLNGRWGEVPESGVLAEILNRDDDEIRDAIFLDE
jgi:hypothetical protein